MARLSHLAFRESEAIAAIRGQGLPSFMGRQLIRLCVISGIRHHPAFAEGPSKALHGILLEFTRSLNAQAIMSNRIPDIGEDAQIDDFPTASGTLTSLMKTPTVVSLPDTPACYLDLYLELEVLPKVSVAEEARANGNTAIFNAIMAQPHIYSVMDDYTRTISLSNVQPALLNGDTAVRPMLDIKQHFSIPHARWYGYGSSNGFEPQRYGLGEDMNITEPEINIYGLDEYIFPAPKPKPTPPWAASMASLLANPLPQDLPMGDKDILIPMAAYYGDIDRYVRLRRPVIIRGENYCIVRGIYHNTMFANWFSRPENIERALAIIPGSNGLQTLKAAIHARFIMSNDLSRLPPDEITKKIPVSELPHLI
ncbi:hypothetical protein B0H63DRAFT_451151 [Podospora didyma]|uniref:Uncharacterized protein n=1 Tax=Podospora didyma TaxID=330526 RepID=A0AAE0NI32_9PEZI|nr:hypothetical protein B0H63DRAFT_451151 [Podospora didyma]